MPLNRKWRSMDFFGSHESLNKSVSNQEKNNRPVSTHEKTDHHSRFPVKNPFRNRLTSIGSRDQQPALAGSANGEAPASGLTQKCIIIQKDNKGYGFTVSGDNPVYVASVKPAGAADRAGVQHGDKIIKVNGTLVTQRNHIDVVKLIKSGCYVALTLLGKPTASAAMTSTPDVLSNRDSGTGFVAAPQPLDHGKDRELWQQKVHMTRAMLETAKEDFEKLQKLYISKPTDKLQSQLVEKERTMKALDHKLKQLTGGQETTSPSSTTSDLCSMSDSPHTSPSVSPTPTDSSTGHNGLDMTDSIIGAADIIHIDDEEVNSGDEEEGNPGPFANINLLEHKPAHMAVFLNYLISNSDPSHVLFYIISDLYQRSNATIKELRKWAYEIFSTFIHKLAPLSISVEDNTISQIENALVNNCNKTDNENVLRAMFQAARQCLHTEIADALKEFTIKKDLGMANLYGIQNVYDNMDRLQEILVVEKLLMPHVKYFSAERNTRKLVSDRDLATGWALATYMRSLAGPKSVQHAQLDSVHTFMMKDKRSIKFPGSRSNRAKAVRGHQFTLQHVYVTTFCNFCDKFIWGVGYQAYRCQSCDMILHKPCADDVKEHCGGKQKKRYNTLPPPASAAPGTNRRTSSLTSVHTANAGTPTWKSEPKMSPIAVSATSKATHPYPKPEGLDIGSTLSIIAGLSGGHAVKSIIGRYQGVTGATAAGQDSLGVADQQTVEDSLPSSKDRRGSSDIVRSGSLKCQDEQMNKPARRANSDITLDTDTYRAMNHSGSSSTSSISNRSMDSSGNSTDNVSAQHDDTDLDVEPELPPLKQLLPEEIIRKLKPKEKKRQEVINELFYTERAHLRNLKVLDLLFYRPMYQEKGVTKDLARVLFPNMEEMISLHVTFVTDIKERQQSAPVVKDVGDLLLQQFGGECGDRFRAACAEYCRNHVFALDALKKHTRKEPKLQQFLHDAESNPLCRRLQLKDLVPSQMQRLTKYPLLIDSLLKYTQSNSEEYRRLERAHDRCKHILAYVNTAVKECENYHKLKDIQKRLDTRPVDGLNDPALAYLKNLDVTQHKLIFDGPLTWKLRTHRTLDMHVLLFEDMLVLLQRLDDRYILKCQNTNAQQIRDDKYTHYPVLKLQNLLARTVATEKQSFFVVNISESRAQMYEFTAASSELRLKWCKLINDKAEELKKTIKQASQADFTGIDRNRPSRISRKGRHTSHAADPGSGPPVQQDALMMVDELPHSLQTSQDLLSETDLILPDEVCIFDAVTSQSLAFSSPVVVASPLGDSCSSWSSVSVSLPVEQLKSISTQNTDSGQAGPVQEVQTSDISNQQEHVDSSAVTSHGLSLASAQTGTSAQLGHGAAVSSSLQGQQEDMLQEKYGLDVLLSSHSGHVTDLSALDVHMHRGIQESTVMPLEECVQPLGLSNHPTDVVVAVAMDTGASLAKESSPIESKDDDDDDDDNNVVSVADLPLPDVTSDIMSSQPDSVHIDGSEMESDDLDTLTFKTHYQDFSSLTTTLEDIDGEEREVETDMDVLSDTSSLVAETLGEEVMHTFSSTHHSHLVESPSEVGDSGQE